MSTCTQDSRAASAAPETPAIDDSRVFENVEELLERPDAMLEKIDDTLGLIAEANSVASGQTPVKQYDISLVIPVYNERDCLPELMERVFEVMPPATEIIIVDDGSDDGTSHWLRNVKQRDSVRVIHRRRNHGKGSAVRLGIRHSQGRVVAIQDADLEYDPADLLRVIWPILEDRADAVYGSRYLDGNPQDGLIHRLGNRALTFLSNRVTGLKLSDMETCHKAFRGEFLRSIPLCETRFGFEPEITAKIAARDAKVLEVPTGYEARGYDEGKKIGWRDGFNALACMWRYRRG